MKRIIVLWGILTTLIGSASCSGDLSPVQEGALTLVISEGGATKASDVTSLGYESKVNQLQVFLFEGTALHSYERLDTGGASFPYTLSYPSIRSGSYRIYVVANAGDLSGGTFHFIGAVGAVHFDFVGFLHESVLLSWFPSFNN